MKKRSEAIEVAVTGDEVFISQPSDLQNDFVIRVPYEQIPQLVGWLREAEVAIDLQRAGKKE